MSIMSSPPKHCMHQLSPNCERKRCIDPAAKHCYCPQQSGSGGLQPAMSVLSSTSSEMRDAQLGRQVSAQTTTRAVPPLLDSYG